MEISDGEEQRIVIKFLTKLGKNRPQIFRDLSTVYGENALKQPTVFKWVKRFREGRVSVKDDKRLGRPILLVGRRWGISPIQAINFINATIIPQILWGSVWFINASKQSYKVIENIAIYPPIK